MGEFWGNRILPSRPLTVDDFAYIFREREAILEAGHLALGFPTSRWLDPQPEPAFEMTAFGFITRENIPLRQFLRRADAGEFPGFTVPEEWYWCHKQ